MLTIADEGGGGVSQKLTIADRGGAGGGAYKLLFLADVICEQPLKTNQNAHFFFF